MRQIWLSILLVLCAAPIAAQPEGHSLAAGDLNLFDLTTGGVIESQILAEPTESEGLTRLPGGELLSLDAAGGLWRIDPASGATSFVGSTGVAAASGAGLTYDGCGILWLAAGSDLYQVDSSTGAATFVVPLTQEVHGLTTRGPELLALASDAGSRRLGLVDPATGTVTSYGDVAPSGGQGLDFDADGRLWAVSVATPPFGFDAVTEFDPETGAILQTQTYPVASGIFGPSLAASTAPGACGNLADVPVSNVAAWILAAALLLAGAVRSRSV